MLTSLVTSVVWRDGLENLQKLRLDEPTIGCDLGDVYRLSSQQLVVTPATASVAPGHFPHVQWLFVDCNQRENAYAPRAKIARKFMS